MKRYRYLCLVLLACFLLMGSPMHACASPSSTRQEIKDKEKEREQLEKEQGKNNTSLSKLKSKQEQMREELNELNQQVEETSLHLDELQQQLNETAAQILVKQAEIQTTQTALDEAVATQKWQYDCMVVRVKKMYEQRDTTILNSFLTLTGLASFLNMEEYYGQIEAYDQAKLEEYKQNAVAIEEQRERLVTEKADLQVVQIDLREVKKTVQAEKDKLDGLIEKTKSTIAVYADQIDDAEKTALAYEKALLENEKDLEALNKKLEEEIAKSRQAAGASWRNISDITFAANDRYLLANLIYCEAGGEPYEGQVAVGAVVINRVLSSVYPDTVSGVIYQKSQFSPVGSGRLAIALSANKATESCYQAADEAMAGMSNVGNCVYFRTPIPGLSGISIGGHIFY